MFRISLPVAVGVLTVSEPNDRITRPGTIETDQFNIETIFCRQRMSPSTYSKIMEGKPHGIYYNITLDFD